VRLSSWLDVSNEAYARLLPLDQLVRFVDNPWFGLVFQLVADRISTHTTTLGLAEWGFNRILLMLQGCVLVYSLGTYHLFSGGLCGAINLFPGQDDVASHFTTHSFTSGFAMLIGDFRRIH
jgi:hypothetical protein